MGILETRMAPDFLLVPVNDDDDSRNAVACVEKDGAPCVERCKESSIRGFFLVGEKFMVLLSPRIVPGANNGCVRTKIGEVRVRHYCLAMLRGLQRLCPASSLRKVFSFVRLMNCDIKIGRAGRFL